MFAQIFFLLKLYLVSRNLDTTGSPIKLTEEIRKIDHLLYKPILKQDHGEVEQDFFVFPS